MSFDWILMGLIHIKKKMKADWTLFMEIIEVKNEADTIEYFAFF